VSQVEPVYPNIAAEFDHAVASVLHLVSDMTSTLADDTREIRLAAERQRTEVGSGGDHGVSAASKGELLGKLRQLNSDLEQRQDEITALVDGSIEHARRMEISAKTSSDPWASPWRPPDLESSGRDRRSQTVAPGPVVTLRRTRLIWVLMMLGVVLILVGLLAAII
jgi:hypothetical protein